LVLNWPDIAISTLGRSPLSAILLSLNLLSSSTADILNRMDEDALFGVHLFQVDDHPVSRDLLDSVREIDFIRNHIDLEKADTSILDIGAGYGRLVYRLSQVAPPNVRIYGTDAVAESTFLSEFYLRFRGAPRAMIVPLDEVEAFIKSVSINLATNIHSFSECMPDAIEWWVRRLAAGGIANLLVIPNHVDQKTRRCLTTTTGADMELIFERYGYKVRVREPRFKDPLVQSYGIAASLISLFELQ